MGYKCFLFDWDGTIADNLTVWFDKYKEVLAREGIEMDFLDIGRKMIGNVNGPAEVGVSNLESFYKRLEEILPVIWQGKLNFGVAELLQRIKLHGGKTAVVTTSKRKWIEPAMENAGLKPLVDVFLAREDVVRTKPDPEILNLAIARLGISKEETIMVGDHPKDIQAAIAARIDGCLYYPKRYEKFYTPQEMSRLGQKYTIENFGELTAFI